MPLERAIGATGTPRTIDQHADVAFVGEPQTPAAGAIKGLLARLAKAKIVIC
jgi:hypothetical protein